MAELSRRGVMLVLASPSGAGKSSISRALFENDPNIALSVSVTTRARRTDEIDHKHYHFVDQATFETMRAAGELLESAEVHGNFYGTPRERVEERLFALRAAARKHHVTADGLIEVLAKYRAELDMLQSGEESLKALEEQAAAAREVYLKAAAKLSADRDKAAKALTRPMAI